ncbi:MAG: glutamyl-tRNA reductase [Alicyclobacillus sp.]|nr:glutamyl-tRNA reductase [Alicyclobacillus sp.]
MRIIVVGMNDKTAPVELRERLSVTGDELADVLATLRESRTALESVVLSTCNRIEVYAVVHSARAGEDYLRTLLARRAGMAPEQLAPHLFVLRGYAAADHLMRVACGLDSMVIGETQILGQVRDAYLAAAATGNAGMLLDPLFRRAIQVGKRAQTETGIGQNAVSVSYAAVQLAKKILGDLRCCRVLVLGAGQMSRLAIQHLQAAGVTELAICNRTLARAQQLADEFAGKVVPWDKLGDALGHSDIVIASTGAPGFVLHAEQVAAALQRRGQRPVVLIDIAVPRDIDPAVAALGNAYLYDIDDLQGVVEANLAERERLARDIERMIQEALQEYSLWLSEQEVVPLIAAVRAKGMAIQASVMASLERKLPDLSERDRKLLHKHTMSIVNQLLRDPILNMKALAASGSSQELRVFAQLFGVTEEDVRQWQRGTLWEDGETVLSPPVGFAEAVQRWRASLQRGTNADAEGAARPLHPVLR